MPIQAVPLPSEEIHTPNPHPARGIYGFVLYIVGWLSLFAYLIWAIAPTPLLEQFGISYVPSKTWAVVVPLGVFLATIILPFVFIGINCYRFQGVFDDVKHIDKDFGDEPFTQIEQILIQEETQPEQSTEKKKSRPKKRN